jgi:hypothetical protein
MAVTKTWKIYSTDSKAIGYIADVNKTKIRPTDKDKQENRDVLKTVEYINNALKTENNLTEYFMCGSSPYEAAHEFAKTRLRGSKHSTVLSHHSIQSFAHNELTPEQAFEIGRKLASRYLKGEYQYVLAVHTDKKHFHVHVVHCNTNMFNHRTFLTNEDKGSPAWKKLRAISDELCKEYGLSVIEKATSERGVSHYEHSLNKSPTVAHGWKSRIKLILNATIYESENFDDFLRRIRAKGVEVVYRPENVIKLKYRLEGQIKFVRARTLGTPYDVDGIAARIERFRKFLSGDKIYVPKSPLIDTNTERMQSTENLQLWARVQNMKTVADIMVELEHRGIANTAELGTRIDSLKTNRATLLKTEKSLKSEVGELKYLLSNIECYCVNSVVHEQLRQLTGKKADKFKHENSVALRAFQAARNALKGYEFADNKLPSVEKIRNTIENLTDESALCSQEAAQIAHTIGEFESMRNTLREYLHPQESAKSREAAELEHEKEDNTVR